MQASPGASAASLQITVGGRKVPAGGSMQFGQVGGFVSVPAGTATLSAGKGVTATQNLAAGASYTVLALAKDGKGLTLEVLQDGGAPSGKAALRVVHAAPELGSPDIRLGARVIAQKVKFRDATPYVTVSPGSYKLAVTKPGGTNVVFARTISLSAGTASTAIIAGSAGQPERVILVTDSTKAPRGAPKTGFGGLAGGGGVPWGLALLAALLAGALGVAAQLTRTRRAR